MLSYNKLWVLLESRGMKKTDLSKNKVISTVTLAKLSKNETISSDTIEKICEFLDCQPSDIMEYISDKQMKKTAEQFDNLNRALMEQIKAQGVSEEQFATMMSQIMPDMIKTIYHGGTPMNDIMDKVIDANKTQSE